MNSKEIMDKLPAFTSNILLAVAFATTFVAIFFFTYAKDVERKIVVKNVDYIIDNLSDDVIPFIPDNLKEKLANNLENIKLPNMDEEDKEVLENNHKLLEQSKNIFGPSLIILFLASFIICKTNNIKFSKIITANLILLLMIAITQYSFLNYIIFDWISANPNKVKAEIIKALL